MKLIAVRSRLLVAACILLCVCTSTRADEEHSDDLRDVAGVVVEIVIDAPKEASIPPKAETILKSFTERHLRTAGLRTFSNPVKAAPALAGPLIVKIDAQELRSMTAYNIRIGLYLPAFRISGEHLAVAREIQDEYSDDRVRLYCVWEKNRLVLLNTHKAAYSLMTNLDQMLGEFERNFQSAKE